MFSNLALSCQSFRLSTIRPPYAVVLFRLESLIYVVLLLSSAKRFSYNEIVN